MKCAEKTEAYNIECMPVPYKNIIREDGYYTWCCSVVKHNGLYHLFYSRWKEKYGFVTGWISHSEIAYAVSESIDGPYEFKKVVLGARDRKYWDGTTAHNPYVVVYNNKFYLYYMGTTAPDWVTDMPLPYSPQWYQYRNRQRIGVAVCENPDGEWKRPDKPLFDVNPDKSAWDSLLMSNPAVAVEPDGRTVMIYKGVQDNTNNDLGQPGGKVKMGIAVADCPDGEFVRTDTMFFDKAMLEKHRFLTEDPCIYYLNGKYNLLCRDIFGILTGEAGAVVHMTSENAVENWKMSKKAFIGKKFMWEDGKESVSHIERPFVYLENNVPVMLLGATRLDEQENKTIGVLVPLEMKHN